MYLRKVKIWHQSRTKWSKILLQSFLRRNVINRAGERKPYIMYPMKIQNREFFGLNMKFSMCRDYTKKISKIAPPGKGEKKPKIYRWSELSFLKISNLEGNLEIFKRIVRITCIFSFYFSPFPGGAILENIFVQVLFILNFMFKPKTHHFGFSPGTWCMAFSPRLY